MDMKLDHLVMASVSHLQFFLNQSADINGHTHPLLYSHDVKIIRPYQLEGQTYFTILAFKPFTTRVLVILIY